MDWANHGGFVGGKTKMAFAVVMGRTGHSRSWGFPLGSHSLLVLLLLCSHVLDRGV